MPWTGLNPTPRSEESICSHFPAFAYRSSNYQACRQPIGLYFSARQGQGEILIRYALGASARPLNLIVNGEKHSVLPFPGTGGWSAWKEMAARVDLKKGSNSIVLATNGASGGNIDHLQLIGPKSD